MLVYSSPRFYEREKYHTYYDRETRDAICGNCGHIIGIQERYPDWESKEFSFEEREKKGYKYCPYCAASLKEEMKEQKDKKRKKR